MPDRSAKPAIRISGVRKDYRLYNSLSEQALDVLGLSRLRFWRPVHYKTFKALDGIDLEINRGERVGIVGRNGAGKTTLLKLITGNFAPTAGTIEIDGSVQALMQTGLGFHGEFSGMDNIRSALVYNGLAGDALEEAVADVVDFCELGEFIRQPVKTYSLGMRARLQFAAATAIKPDIVIIDEVLGAGDAYFSAKSAQRVERLAGSGCTLLLVSHSVPQILQFCQRALWLDGGRVRMDKSAREVISAYEVEMENRIEFDKKQHRSSANSVNPAQSWLNELIARQDIGEAEDGVPLQQINVGGKVASRWPGKAGIKITRVLLFGEGGEVSVFSHGESVDIRMEVAAEIEAEFHVKYYFAIFDLFGNRVTWVTSPPDIFTARAGERRAISARLSPLLLGGGSYILSISVFDSIDENRVSADHRHDLLARCLDFKVTERDGRQSPMFHHPADWKFDSGGLVCVAGD